jgi:WD40 repeat protein
MVRRDGPSPSVSGPELTARPSSDRKQRVLVMKGHERNITRVVFSPDGDLLFSAASDKTPTVWDTESGERIGTYNGHSGSITDLSVSCKWQCAMVHACDAQRVTRSCGEGLRVGLRVGDRVGLRERQETSSMPLTA